MGEKTKSLKSNYIFNLISQILTLIIPLITAPYLARVLHEVGNGQISYAQSIITYFTLFANLGFNTYGQREIARHRDDIEKKSAIFWEMVILRTITTAISLAVLFTCLYTFGFGENYNLLIIIMSIQVLACVFDIQFLFQGDEDFKAIAIRTIVIKLIGLVCIFVFVKTENDGWIYALCLSIATIFANMIMWPSAVHRIKRVPAKDIHLKRNIKPALMIFLPTLAVTVYSVFDKTMIGLLSSNPDYDNGCYEQAYKINGVALLIVTVISPVLASRNAHDYEVGNMDGFRHHVDFASNYVLMLGIPLIAGFAVLSPSLSSWFLGEGYAEVPLLLQIMSVRFIVSGFSEICGTQIFIAIGKEKYVTIASIITALVNLVLNWFLIPIYGAVGAAIATACCEFMQVATLMFFAVKQKFISLGKLAKMSWKYIVAAGVMFGGIYGLQMVMGYQIWEFLIIMLAGILIYGVMLLILRDRFAITNLQRVLWAIKARLSRRKKEEPEDK